jgi:hypothetical protein
MSMCDVRSFVNDPNDQITHLVLWSFDDTYDIAQEDHLTSEPDRNSATSDM